MKSFILPFMLAVAVAPTPVVAEQESPAKQAFARMKTLVGTWEGKMGEGADAFDSSVEYKLTGGGSALVETLGPGSPFEMVSIYHMDGDSLVMTHYCGAGNQPTMKFKPGKNPDVLFFDFVSGSNMKPTDMHMHQVTFTFKGKDHHVADWLNYMGGKPGAKAKFDFKRVK